MTVLTVEYACWDPAINDRVGDVHATAYDAEVHRDFAAGHLLMVREREEDCAPGCNCCPWFQACTMTQEFLGIPISVCGQMARFEVTTRCLVHGEETPAVCEAHSGFYDGADATPVWCSTCTGDGTRTQLRLVGIRDLLAGEVPA